jgi:uncharacterized membrane protein YjjP (DUF1212 family)
VAPPHPRSLRLAAARALRSTAPPTQPIALTGADGVDESHARAVLDLTLRVGEALLSTGATASDVTATVLRLAAAYGVTSVHVDVTFTSITVSQHRGHDQDPLTVMRIVKARTADYTRLENLHQLVRAATDGDLDLAAARRRLDGIVRAPHPYRRWLVTAALAGMGASVAALFGGGLVLVLLTAATTAVIDRVQRSLARKGLPAFFTQVVGAAIPTLVAVGLLLLVSRTNLRLEDLPPSLVVATGIIVLLAGLSVVGAAQDALEGYYVTAGARGFEVLVLTLGIVVGVAVVLALASRAGVPMALSTTTQLSANLVVQLVASTAVAGCFAASAYAGLRASQVAAGIGALGWVTFSTSSTLGGGPAASSACAAAVVGLLAQVVAERLRVPTLAVTTAGIVPLLPGLAVYRGLFQLVDPAPMSGLATGLTTLFGAAGVGMGLAIGVSLGTYAGRPLRSSMDRWQRRALRPSRADARE